MKVYLIKFDLKQSIDKYQPLFSLIKTLNWWNRMENTWLIASEGTAKDLYNQLVSFTFQGDLMLIIEVTPNYYGLLPSGGWDWISKNLGGPKNI